MEKKIDFDVLIVGAGLSGIGAAYHLQTNCPNHSYAILEARSAIGGTWDLFQYPGIRSDSDMYTLGYSFRPWNEMKAIADGPSILKYIKDTATDGNINQHIRLNHKVKYANWSSNDSIWTVGIERTDEEKTIEMTCSFLFMCSGYYNYDYGFTPKFQGIEKFQGEVIHPQKWKSDIDYQNKKVVVIGSGATAITLVPELTKKATLVTMLQRSPTYITSAPSEDALANRFRKIFPSKFAYFLSRWKNIIFGIIIYKLCKSFPKTMKSVLIKEVKKELPKDFDIQKHFTPKYDPWDQRLCLVPDSDLFESINEGKTEIVTDEIQSFTTDGILLKSGKEIKTDLVVTATGLEIKVLGGLSVSVDGKKWKLSDLFCYRGMMFNDVPNFAMSFGYTNASWTLKSDLTCEYVCRLLNYMKENNLKQCTPRITENMEEEPIIDFNSSYVLRAVDGLPKQGKKSPWRVHQNYALDIFNFRYSSLKEDELEYK